MSKEAIVDLLYDFGTRADISVEDLAEEICRVAIPVVRCKDCKHAQDGGPGFVWCQQSVGSLVEESGYCAWGERKDDA